MDPENPKTPNTVNTVCEIANHAFCVIVYTQLLSIAVFSMFSQNVPILVKMYQPGGLMHYAFLGYFVIDIIIRCTNYRTCPRLVYVLVGGNLLALPFCWIVLNRLALE